MEGLLRCDVRMLSARYLDPTARTFDESVLGWLLTELPTASALHLLAGYFDASVLDWLEEPIEALLGRGGTVRAIIGSNGGQTSAADVERLYSIIGDGLSVEYAEGGLFHPKVYVLEHPDRIQAVVGSSNFTVAGSLVNVEASLIVETDELGPPPEEPLDSILNSVDPTRHPHATQISDISVIAELKRLGVIDRVVRRAAPAGITASGVSRQRKERQNHGFDRRGVVSGIPGPTRRRVVVAPRSVLAKPVPMDAVIYCGLAFSRNDLKDTGTREISVSSGIREWASSVVGRQIGAGEGTLFEMEIEARLAVSPGEVFRTPEPVRIWSAGNSGGTHQDVRLLLGNSLKAELDDEATVITGLPIPPGSIGVFELPPEPDSQAVRLTVFLPDDPEFDKVAARLGRTGREQKLHFRTDDRPEEIPAWTT